MRDPNWWLSGVGAAGAFLALAILVVIWMATHPHDFHDEDDQD